MKNIMILTVTLLFAETAFGRFSAAELNVDWDALKAKGSAVYDINRNSNLGFCLSYMNAVMDSFEDNHNIEVIKDFIVGKPGGSITTSNVRIVRWTTCRRQSLQRKQRRGRHEES